MKPTRLSKGWDPTSNGLLSMLVLVMLAMTEATQQRQVQCDMLSVNDTILDIISACMDQEVASRTDDVFLNIGNVDAIKPNAFLEKKKNFGVKVILKERVDRTTLTFNSVKYFKKGLNIINTNINSITFPSDQFKSTLDVIVRGNRFLDKTTLEALKKGHGGYGGVPPEVQKEGECMVNPTQPDLKDCVGVYEDLHLTSTPDGIENFQPEWITGCLKISDSVLVPYNMFDKLDVTQNKNI